MSELIFIILMLIIYFIGFFAGKGWERKTWEDKDSTIPKPKIVKKIRR